MNLQRYVHVPVKNAILGTISYQSKIPSNKCILICADPRGGSTWLTELINTESGSAIIWEPLHIGQNRLFKDIGFGYRQHIPMHDTWTEAKSAFQQVFSGKNLNHWTTQFTSIKELLNAERLIIKLCRASLLLPWLVKNFSFDRTPIFLVRHPLAVVASQLRHGSWSDISNTFSIPDVPYNEPFIEHKAFLSSMESCEEVLLATWCITNSYILNHPNNNIDWISLTYEDLLINPKQQLKRIYKQWGVQMPTSLLQYESLPSKTTLTSSPIYSKEKQLRHWKNYFTKDQLYKFKRILNYFEIGLYNDELLPQKSFS